MTYFFIYFSLSLHSYGSSRYLMCGYRYGRRRAWYIITSFVTFSVISALLKVVKASVFVVRNSMLVKTYSHCSFKIPHKLDFCLTVHHQLGKVIQMNQLDATMIYWSVRAAQHVSGNILPIIRSMRLGFLQHMVSCCCGGHIVPRCHSPSPCPPQQQDNICCKNLSLTLLMIGKILPETC